MGPLSLQVNSGPGWRRSPDERGSAHSGLRCRSCQRAGADHRVPHTGLLRLWRTTGGGPLPRKVAYRSDYLLAGLRHLALDRAVYWFRPRPEQRVIQVPAVFFGGQDHQRRMLVRLLQKSSEV